jgi:hypothetical protein
MAEMDHNTELQGMPEKLIWALVVMSMLVLVTLVSL